MEVFWFALSAVQVGFATVALAALLSWRGERLWPARGRPFAPAAVILAGVLFVLAVAAMVSVGDVEFNRYVGTGSLLLVGLGLFVSMVRRGGSEPG